jgi:hypothetical protein
MEVASAIQRGRTSANQAAGTSNSNARHQPTRPKHSLAPTLFNDANADHGEGSMEGQTGPESSELCQEGRLPVTNRVAIPAVPVDNDQRMQQDPLLDMPLPTQAIHSKRKRTNEVTTMREPEPQASWAPPDVPSAIPSREASQTPEPQRWSWANTRDKQKKERAKTRIQLTKLCSVCSKLKI